MNEVTRRGFLGVVGGALASLGFAKTLSNTGEAVAPKAKVSPQAKPAVQLEPALLAKQDGAYIMGFANHGDTQLCVFDGKTLLAAIDPGHNCYLNYPVIPKGPITITGDGSVFWGST